MWFPYGHLYICWLVIPKRKQFENLLTWIFIAAYPWELNSIIIQMSIHWWMDKQNVVCPHNGILLSRNRKEVLIQATAQMNLENTALWERNQRQKAPSYGTMIPFIWEVQNSQIHRQKEKKTGRFEGLRGGRIKGRWLRGDQHVLKLILLMTAQDCDYAAAAASVVPDSVRPHRQPTRLPRPWDSPGKNTGVGCHVLPQCRKVKSESEVAQSCPTLHNPMDCSLPGSSVHGIFQARVLEWGAIAFSILHTIKLYALDRWIVWYVNYSFIKLLQNNTKQFPHWLC